MQSLVTGDDEPDGDGLALTRLATRLQNRIPDLCVLKTFYDGRETVPLQSVPKAATTTASAVYRRFVDICPLNLAHTIADAVITSQHPTGFVLSPIRRCGARMRMTCGISAAWMSVR